jgi:membrane protein
MRLPRVLKNIWDLITATVNAWLDDRAPSMGAALAYYTLFSIAPLLLIVISVAGIVFGPDAARGEVFSQLKALMGESGASTINQLVESVSSADKSGLAAAIGLVVLLIGATTVFAELQDSLDRIWQVPERKKSAGLWALLRSRLLSFGMILGIGFLLMVSLVFSAAFTAMGRWWSPWFGEWATVLQVVNAGASLALVTLLFTMIYKFMPRANIAWRDVWIGAAVTALLFTIGKTLIGIYLGSSGITSTYGAAGSLVVVLLWVYYSAQIFLLGAEFTWAFAHRHGSRRNTRPIDKSLPLGHGTNAVQPG